MMNPGASNPWEVIEPQFLRIFAHWDPQDLRLLTIFDFYKTLYREHLNDKARRVFGRLVADFADAFDQCETEFITDIFQKYLLEALERISGVWPDCLHICGLPLIELISETGESSPEAVRVFSLVIVKNEKFRTVDNVSKLCAHLIDICRQANSENQPVCFVLGGAFEAAANTLGERLSLDDMPIIGGHLITVQRNISESLELSREEIMERGLPAIIRALGSHFQINQLPELGQEIIYILASAQEGQVDNVMIGLVAQAEKQGLEAPGDLRRFSLEDLSSRGGQEYGIHIRDRFGL